MSKIRKARKFEVTLHTGLTVKVPGPTDEYRADALQTLSWILRCFEHAIETSYRKGSQRRNEAYAICRQINTTVYENSTPEEGREYLKGFSWESVPPGSFDAYK
jgi:hypothetical protein